MTATGLLLATIFVGRVDPRARVRYRPGSGREGDAHRPGSRQAYGDGVVFVLFQVVTTLILVLAANTGFNGAPRLARILALDGYVPRQFAIVGDRLAYSWGIAILAGFGLPVHWLFDASVAALIPLYSIGIFLSLRHLPGRHGPPLVRGAERGMAMEARAQPGRRDRDRGGVRRQRGRRAFPTGPGSRSSPSRPSWESCSGCAASTGTRKRQLDVAAVGAIPPPHRQRTHRRFRATGSIERPSRRCPTSAGRSDRISARCTSPTTRMSGTCSRSAGQGSWPDVPLVVPSSNRPSRLFVRPLEAYLDGARSGVAAGPGSADDDRRRAGVPWQSLVGPGVV